MAPSILLLSISLSILYINTKSEQVTCRGDCECNEFWQSSAAPCTLNCAAPDICKSSTLSCGAGRSCTVLCTHTSSCSDYTYINALLATDLTVVCDGIDACKSKTTILCGTGTCKLHCGKGTSCEEIGVVDTSKAHQFICINCPSYLAELQFTFKPTKSPTKYPSRSPTKSPTYSPSKTPTYNPTYYPTHYPTYNPTNIPTFIPTDLPTDIPTYIPSKTPTNMPTQDPTNIPTIDPSNNPTTDPTYKPSTNPTINPTNYPSIPPTKRPSKQPSISPTHDPTLEPTQSPSISPSIATHIPSMAPTTNVSMKTTKIKDGAVDGDISYANNNKRHDNLVLPMLLLCLFLLLTVIARWICWYKKKRNQNNVLDKIENIPLEELSPQLHYNKNEYNYNDLYDIGLMEIVQEGSQHVFGVGSHNYKVKVHLNGKQCVFSLPGTESGDTDDCEWNENTYDQLRNAIKKRFNIRHNKFQLHEMVNDFPVHIDDIGDIAASFDCCVYDTNRRSIDLFVKKPSDLHFPSLDDINEDNETNAILDGEQILTDSENDIITIGQ